MDPLSAIDNDHNGNEQSMVRSDDRKRNSNVNRMETTSEPSVSNKDNREVPPLLARDAVGAGGDANSIANIPAPSLLPDDNDEDENIPSQNNINNNNNNDTCRKRGRIDDHEDRQRKRL